MSTYEQLAEDEDFLCYNISSSSSSPLDHMTEFEFLVSYTKLAKMFLTSPADELFYYGKLLQLQLPTRLQMIKNLPQTSQTLFSSATTNVTIQFESCHVSALTSCYVSGEQNPECPSAIIQHSSKSSSKKLKSMKQSLKFKASKAYLKSLFTKTSDGPCEATTDRESSFVEKLVRKNLMTRRESGGGNNNRRSFSAASSSGSSFDSSPSDQQQELKRKCFVKSEVENSIYEAISYCKKSQKSASNDELSSDCAVKIAATTASDCEVSV